MRDDLLRAQRNSRGVFGRQRECFVQRIRVQRLRSAEHRSQRLNRDANDVVVRLLRGQRASRGLRVEAQNGRSRILALEPLRHHLVPDLARRAVLGDLFEKVVVRVEEERQPRRERHRHPVRPGAPIRRTRCRRRA